MRGVRDRMKRAEELAEDDHITPLEVIEEDAESIAEKVELAKYRRGIIGRTLNKFKKCRTANDVFAETALDAAKAKVLEMHLAQSSTDRQRAQDTILDRALGKSVDRSVSVAMSISSKSEPELDHDIERLLAEFGYQGGERKDSPIFVGGEGKTGIEEIDDVRSESRVEWRTGIPRKIYTIDG